jgi:hypothetical protein
MKIDKPSTWSWIGVLLVAIFAVRSAADGHAWRTAIYAFVAGAVLTTNLIFLLVLHPVGKLIDEILEDR